MENWKFIQGFEDSYEVSNTGKVRSISSKKGMWGKELKPLPNKRGYFRVALRKNNRPYFYAIHRLVAVHFIANPENKPEVNHKDGNKANNNDWNLEWNTRLENREHSVISGLSTRGERNNKSKLTEAEVIKILTSLKNGVSNKELAEKYNINKTSISNIKAGRQWKYLKSFV